MLDSREISGAPGQTRTGWGKFPQPLSPSFVAIFCAFAFVFLDLRDIFVTASPL
jgi:hypothetical protein